MRLIDADAFEIILKEMQYDEETNHIEKRKYSISEINSLIQQRPTAYEIEKVVEEVQNIHLPLASQTSRIVGVIRKGGVE